LCSGSDIYVGYFLSGTITTAKKNTITNNGSANAYPKFIFKRSGGTSAVVEYIKNETTGATLWLNYSLLDGEELIIDLTPGGRSVTSSFFGDVWRALLRNSDFADFYLLPGANDVSVFINNNGATLTAYALWRDEYLSADGVAP
jgi:phage-related protein